jgi:hypothetical protein
MRPRELLARWLSRQIPAEAQAWLDKSAAQVRSSGKDADLYLAVSLVTRKVGKADLMLTEADLRDASTSRNGWDPRQWSADQAARVMLISRVGKRSVAPGRGLEQLCNTADVGEQAAF